MENYTRISDTISSSEGKVFITVDGRVRELFEVQTMRAQIELIVTARRMLGNRMEQHKVVGARGTGSATLYFMNSEQLNNTIEYIRSGRFANNKLQVRNEDPQSTIGKQEVVLLNSIFATIPVAAVEESDDPITFDSDFTFDGIEKLSSFALPSNYR
ncbi:MAG: XkdM protein phage-like element [Herbinix sp.]|nr:XkdM protein phage-like element [Herbinix sp.]